MRADVSVVIPYYEAASTIGRALESIKIQNLAVKEVIIVNDGSDFYVLKNEVKNFIELNLILINLGSNFGAAFARNIGVQKSSASFIAFLDADDVWHPEKVAIQYEVMLNSGAYFSCHKYVSNLNYELMKKSSIFSIKKLQISSLLLRNCIFTPTVMVRREGFVGFDNRIQRSEDLKCWISNFSNGVFLIFDSALAGGYKRPVGESGLSKSLLLMHQGYLDAWKLLYFEKKINFWHYLVATIIESIKYPIRLFVHR